jgi:hypothetical protein
MKSIATAIAIIGLVIGYLAGSAVEQSQCQRRVDERVEKFRAENVRMSTVIVRQNREIRNLRAVATLGEGGAALDDAKATNWPRYVHDHSVELTDDGYVISGGWYPEHHPDRPAVAEIPQSILPEARSKR